MRLPDLAGYRLEKLVGEDPFGWNFQAGDQGSEKRLVRILKAQATQDQGVASIYQTLNKVNPTQGVAKIHSFSRRLVGVPSAISVQFPGWKGRHGDWRLSSISYIGKLIEKEAAVSTGEMIIHTIGDLHRSGIVHGGIHPGNVFVTGKGDEPVIKFSGFGEIVTPGLLQLSASYLPFYIAPEQLLPNGQRSPDELAAWDVYSTGVIIYQLITKHLPRLDRLYRQFLENSEQMDKLQLISNRKLTGNATPIFKLLDSERELVWPDQHSSDVDKCLRNVVERCLAFNKEDRFKNMAEVSDTLQQSIHALNDQPQKQTETTSTPPAKPQQTELPPKKTRSHAKPVNEISLVSPSAPPPSKEAMETLDEIFAEVSEPEKPKKKSGDGKIVEKIPVVRQFKVFTILDKIVALLIAAAVVGLGSTSFLYKRKVDATEQKSEKVLNDMQANIQRQAKIYKDSLSKSVKSAESLKEAFNQTEDKKARLVAEAKLTRELLRQSQDNGDQFFRLILENGDSDVPAFREKRLVALGEGQKHYRRLIEIYGDAPDFIVSTAHAYYYLGRIQREMGEFAKALVTFQEAEKRYEALMESERNGEFTENLATAKRELGDLAFSQGNFPLASHLFDKSSGHWQGLGELDGDRNLDVAIEVNGNSLKISECLNALGHREDALKGADQVANQFLILQKNFPHNERVIGGLANSFGFLGKLYRTEGKGDKALLSFQQSADLFAEAIRKNSSVDKYHLGLGFSLAQIGLIKNDTTKLTNAASVLAEVIARNPYEPTYIQTMAEVYGVLSENQQNGGRITNAIKLEEEALGMLEPIVHSNKNVALDVYFSYAERLVHLAELRVDARKFDDSRAPLKQAIAVLGKISQEENSLPVYRRTLATARGLAGFASLKSGDKSSAKSYYQLAKDDWVAYMADNPNDSDAATNARWTSDQLKSLR